MALYLIGVAVAAVLGAAVTAARRLRPATVQVVDPHQPRRPR